MITIASKHTLNLFRPNGDEAPLTTIAIIEKKHKSNNYPIANLLFGFEVNPAAKVMAIENRFINGLKGQI